MQQRPEIWPTEETQEFIRALGRSLIERGWSLAVAESVTVGHVQVLIGSVSGASEFFLGGVTAYRAEQKIHILGVQPEIAHENQGVTRHTAEQMARGALTLFGADLALATTGFAEPAPEQGALEPMAYLAIAVRGPSGEPGPSILVERLEVTGPRLAAQRQLAEAACFRLYKVASQAR